MSLLRGSVVALFLVPCWVPAAPSAAASGAAPGVPAELLRPLEWRSIGPYRGGRVLAVSGVPADPNRFYFGAVNGGVWETRNAGRTWAPVFDAAPVGSIGAVAVASADARIIYVGTGEADMRSDIAQGAGLYRSDDAGRSWRPLGLADSQQIGRILVDPANPDVLLVAALGHPYGANETRGVYRSTDGGRTWQRTLYRDADTGAIDLAAGPQRLDVVYAALWQTRRPPWSVYPPSSGPGSGLYKSLDGGRTWSELAGHGLPEKPGRIGIAVAPSRPQRVFALIDAPDGGLYRSDDAGASWTRVSGDARIWKRGWYFGGVTVDPLDPEVVYVCNTAIYRSGDGGRNFVPVKGAPGGDDYHTLWIDPRDPQRRILGSDQGAVVTVDGGASWSSWFNQPTGQFYHVATDDRFPYWVYGAQQDSGAAGIPSRTDNIDGINLRQFVEIAAGDERDNIAPDPDDPQLVFGGRVDRLDQRTGQTRSVAPTLAEPGLYRSTWTLPLTFGKRGSHTLYFANQRIFRTTDGGRHWQPISPDLSREDPATPANLDAATIADHENGGARRGVVYAIGPSPLDARLIWAGTDDGLLWRTRDGGGHWQNVTPASLSAWSKIGVVEPSHFDAGRAYLAVDRHRLDDPQPYLYRTRDGGASWQLIVTGLAADGMPNSANVVREDPLHRGLLYCGSERGVYVSFDDGDHWQALQQNLPRTSVRDLVVHGNDLVIATHGRGLWIMDDVSLLRSLADDPRGGVRLFPPARAYRVRPSGFVGSPSPKDEPRGANPAAGAYLDYALDESSGGPVTLTVTDAHGATVRSFSSADPHPPPDLARIDTTADWVEPPAVPATGAGAHRLVWDLHYAPKASLAAADPAEKEDGVWAPPGRYWVELAAGGQHYRQPLTIAPDPRVHLPPAAYRRQFALARDIEGARVEIAAALDQAGRVRSALEERRTGASAAAATALAAADERLLAISDLAPAPRSPDSLGPAPGTVRGLRYLGEAFRNLARAVDGADAAPSVDAERGYARHRALLEETLADWDRFRYTELPRLDAQLRADGVAPLTP